MIKTLLSVRFAIGFLILTHVSGLIGLQTEYRDWFLLMTPFNLLLSFALLMLHHRHWKNSFILFVGVTFLVGYGIEVTGVHTGWPFGEYRYGETLGFKLWEVPLLIGVNWVMLIYASGIVVQGLRAHRLVKALLAAVMMVLLDYLIEPVAIAYDFWSWDQHDVPFINYLGWFGVALPLCLLFQYLPFAKANKVAAMLFLIQVIFFGILNFIS